MASVQASVNPFSDQVGGSPTGNQWIPIFSPVLTNGALGSKQEWWYSHPVTTGASASFHVATSAGSAAQASMCVIALSGSAANGPVLMESFGTVADPTVNLALTHPAGDEFVLTTVTHLGGMITAGPPGFSAPVIVPPVPSSTYGLAMAWKSSNSGAEMPTWTFDGSNATLMVGLMFAPNVVTPPPVLVFTQQPTTTVTGQPFSPTIQVQVPQ
jgi:hypothetical protein